MDPNQKTIEHPTDVEDAHDPEYDQSEFDPMNQTPDIRLKSIEVDAETTVKKRKNELDDTFQINVDHNDDDGSGTGHKVSKNSRPSTQKSTLVQSNSYGSSTDTQLKNQRDKAILLAQKMK
mgnify:CR=1 FL=1|jgi:hypothetical protein